MVVCGVLVWVGQQAVATAFSQIYVIPLIALFAHFYISSYRKKAKGN